MSKYITRTFENYNTDVTFVMDGQLNNYELSGIVGKKQAKIELKKMFGDTDIVIASVNKKLINSKLYRISKEKFLEYAEEITAIPKEE